MNINHIQGIFSPEHGGPTQSLSNYARFQAADGHRVQIWALEGFPNISPAMRLDPPIEMMIFQVEKPARLGGSAEMMRRLRSAESPDVYHLHGAWLRAMHYGASEALRRERPYVLEVMGMYEPWCLRQKWPSKRIARWWFQDRVLQNASCLHVNSMVEAQNIRAQGFKTPIAVIPVGVDVEEIIKRKAAVPADSPWPELRGLPYILFLSRLHPKKGVELLIRSWAQVLKERPGRNADWMLAIAGTGDKEYAERCRQLANELGIADRCFFAGHVDELQKTWLYSHAQCYVLPSYNDNFGNTVAEALAHATPVIATKHTPWKSLVENNCGWLTDTTEADLSQPLKEALDMNAATRAEMGARGESLVRRRYSLDFTCKSIFGVYQWLLGKSGPPDFVTN